MDQNIGTVFLESAMSERRICTGSPQRNVCGKKQLMSFFAFVKKTSVSLG